MKSASDFVKALERGLSPEAALSSLVPYQLEYQLRLPVDVYCAAKELGWLFCPVPRHRPIAKPTTLNRWSTCDVEQLKRWARQRPNWALATGPISGVFVLEVDGNHGGTSLLALCGDDWDWLATLRTMAGPKRYIFFSWPQGWRQARGRQEICSGLRIIGDGDSLLVPPSREGGYCHLCINRQPVAQPPIWLLDAYFEKVIAVAPSEIRTYRAAIPVRDSSSAIR